QLGVEAAAPAITELRHVRSAAEKHAAEEIANRQKCEDFESFKPLFEQVQKELAMGLRQTRRFERKSEIAPGRFYILGGQKTYFAATEEPFTNEPRQHRRTPSGDLRQRDGKQPAHALP